MMDIFDILSSVNRVLNVLILPSELHPNTLYKLHVNSNTQEELYITDDTAKTVVKISYIDFTDLYNDQINKTRRQYQELKGS